MADMFDTKSSFVAMIPAEPHNEGECVAVLFDCGAAAAAAAAATVADRFRSLFVPVCARASCFVGVASRGRAKTWSGQRRKYRWAPKSSLPLIPGERCAVFLCATRVSVLTSGVHRFAQVH